MLQKLQDLFIDLKNIVICKKSRLFNSFSYPYTIIPSINFKKKIGFDTLISHQQNIYILRRSNLEEKDTFRFLVNGQFILNDDAIDIERIADLSVNLMGGNFTVNHSHFKTLGDGSKKWTGDKVYLMDYLNSYSIDKGKGNIFIKASNLHNIKFPYH